jgi:TolB-like protein/Flp pilus assembly protein TadD
LGDKPTEAAAPGPPQSESGTAAPVSPAAPIPRASGEAQASWWDSVWPRIKERKIVQWTAAYVAFAFVALHGATLLSDALEWPHVIVRVVTFLLILGLPIVPILAWYHGVRALKRVSGSELIIITLLLVIGGSLLWLLPRPNAEGVRTETPNPLATINPKPESGTEIFAPLAHSIAVLPFTDMSEKHDQEYFGDGMAEEILDLLAKVPGLTVIGRTSSFQFKGKNEDLRTIGTKLNAAYVLEGSVRNSGEQIRITAQLINTRTGAHGWSETYDRRFGDVLKLQDAIALAVVRELQLTVVPADLDSRAALKNTEAYALMLRGRHAFDRLDKEGLDEAVSLFQQALDRDPALADAASWLGRAYVAQGDGGFALPGLMYEPARRMAELALKLDPRSAEAHAVLANIHFSYDWDWAAADREIQQAKSIAPGDPYVQRAGAILAMVLGRWDDALKQIKAAVVIDPLDPLNYIYMWEIQDRIGQLTEAESSLRRELAISPTHAWGHYNLAYLLVEQGDRDGALSEIQRETNRDFKQLGLAMVLHALGRKTESDAALAWFIKEDAGTYASSIADIYALRGQSDEAMRWLERAFTQRDSNLLMIKVDTALVPLNGDPRFKALLRKMNLPE